MSLSRLSDAGKNVYSQFGEDGILEVIFERLGKGGRRCVEFGAWDGFHFSNTANLWTRGWSGVLIEAREERYVQLKKNVAGHDCLCLHRKVGFRPPDRIEDILRQQGLPLEVDLLSIDIDGDDYYVFESLEDLRPRVLCCEYNPTFPPHLDLRPLPGNRFGCSPLSLVCLAESKGYRLVALTETNLFFVREEDARSFSDFETRLSQLAIDRHLTYLINGHDGSWILSQQPTFGLKRPSGHGFVGPYHVPALPQSASSGSRRRALRGLRSRFFWALHRFNPKVPQLPAASPDPAVLEAWRRDRGDATLRLRYPLEAGSLVLDVGGYQGQWSSDIFGMYGCRIQVFEPVPDAAAALEQRFAQNPRIRIFDHGLGARTESVHFVEDRDRSSAFLQGPGLRAPIRSAREHFEAEGLSEVDLVKINIEGGEFELLEHLIDTGLVGCIHDLQIQFHRFIEGADAWRLEIQRRLRETHQLTWEYPFVWESWRRR